MPKGVELVCPQCKEMFSQRLLCPRCGVRLQAPALPGGSAPELTLPTSWLQSPLSRIIVGLILAQGLYYGLLSLTRSILMAASNDPSYWAHLAPVILLQGLQALAILAGATLAGAGQRWGFVFGCLVGVGNSLLFLVAQAVSGQLPSAAERAVELYGSPIVHSAFGVLGGFIGSQIWKPPLILTVPGPIRARPSELRLPRKPSPFSGPIVWGRVLVGVSIAVIGTVMANQILDYTVTVIGPSRFTVDRYRADFITWEISVLSVIIGSAWAGANTRNGMKQGWVVGIIAAAILFGIYMIQEGRRPPEVTLGFVLAGIHLRGVSIHMQALIFTIINVLALGLVGGWFGGQLFPPLYTGPRHRDVAPGAY
jgi:hypothetical protein